MSYPMVQLQEATIKAQCKTLRMPMVASQFGTLAEQAIREKQSHIGYLEALLLAEIEERERNTIERRIREAHLPRVKTLEEFDYTQSPNVTAAKMRDLAEGGYIDRAEPVLFIGECGTGKTHLLTGLCVAACRQKRRVRFTTAAGLVNELVEAKHQLQLRRVMARWSRYDLIAIDEVGYVPLAEVGAEFLFQVVAERAEKAAVVLTTNLPFPSGRRSSRTRDSAKRCWIESPIELTSWRRAQNPIASAEPRKNKRREPSRNDTGQAVEMTVRGKPGKPKSGFPPFPPPLEIASRFPHSHSFDDCLYIR